MKSILRFPQRFVYGIPSKLIPTPVTAPQCDDLRPVHCTALSSEAQRRDQDLTHTRFWKLQELVQVRENQKARSGFFFLPSIPFDISYGIPPLFSAKQLRYHYEVIHGDIVAKLNEHVLGTIFEAQPLDVVVMKTALDATQATIHHYATQHFNHSFLWMSLLPHGSSIPPNLTTAILRQYGSMNALKDCLRSAVLSLFQCSNSGWVFFAWDGSAFKILSLTEPGSSILPYGYVPLLAMDLWYHSYGHDYDKESITRESDMATVLVDKYWLAFNWKQAAQSWSEASAKTVK